jgi:hypothetical protein
VHPGPPSTNAFCVPDVERSFLTVHAEVEGRSVRVGLTGTADLRCQLALDNFFTALHRQAMSAAADEVNVDVRGLEFMSAACFRLVVEWLCRVDEAARPYRVSFVANRARAWQQRSMAALSSLAGGFVSVTFEA